MTQTYDTDWDIDAYYDSSEPEHYWELRREFMRIHKDKFPEDYLVALANAYTNVEFMDCSYPAALMVRLAELGKEVSKEFRQKKNIERNLVSAKNAYENKIAGKRQRDAQNDANKRRY